MNQKYVALLRGINVGGHHKVPMLDLRSEFEKLGFKKVITLLNSGNILFETEASSTKLLEQMIANSLEKCFGFSIPTIVNPFSVVQNLIIQNPFSNIEVTKDLRLYVSFLQDKNDVEIPLPWASSDNSFQILEKRQNCIISVLDLSVGKTPKAMEALEKIYGKNLTTRNWNTLAKIATKAK